MFKHFARGAAGLLALGFGVALQPAAADAATTAIYSDPVYWPLHVQSYVDCTKTNPGCSQHHSFWGVDVIPTGQRNGQPISKAGVYSMGAGIAHIGNAHGDACGTGTATDMGTWVWVDHGGGVVSRYEHLSSISISDGQHVGAGALLGIIGNTGDSSKLYCDESYLDFSVLHNGVHGPTVEFSTRNLGSPDGDLIGCNGSAQQAWPAALNDGISRIENMPEKTVIPASSWNCQPAFLAASLNYSPTAQVSAGKGKLTANWSGGPGGTDDVRIEIGLYHPSIDAYDSQWNEQWRDLSPSTHSLTVSGLKHKGKYEVRVWYHTSAGWKANTGFKTVKVK